MNPETRNVMAQSAATVRAAHQLLDDPLVFPDKLALLVIGEDGELLKSFPERFQTPGSRHMRAFVAARSRYAEDELVRCIRHGAEQYVVLGAGLDTYACRNPDPASKLRIFEVDYPTTQAWKQDRLAKAKISIPSSVVFVPLDLEKPVLSGALERSGFDRQKITFFSWLGVTPYLVAEAAMATLEFIASMPRKSCVVFDYAVSQTSLNPIEQTALKVLMKRVARAGEPFQLFFEPMALIELLRRLGFSEIADLGPAEIDSRYFKDRSDGLRVSAGLARLINAQI